MAELRLDQKQFAFDAGVIEPGDSSESLLIQRMVDEEKKLGIVMPPTVFPAPGSISSLSPDQIDALRTWVDAGAEWPDDVVLAVDSSQTRETLATGSFLALIRAANVDAIKQALGNDANLATVSDRTRSTALMYAALYADVPMMRLLIDAGADVNAKNNSGITALMWSVDDIEKVRRLLRAGAVVDARTNLRRTALLIATTYSGNLEVVKLLLDHGADVKSKDTYDETVLTSAAKRSDADMVRELILAGADLNARSFPLPVEPSFTPLAWAAREGNIETVKLLLEHGAADDEKSLQTALLVACLRGATDKVRLLLEHGADPNQPGEVWVELTPLMAAAYSDSVNHEVVRLLLKNGGDFTKENAKGQTALSLALQRGRTSVVEALVEAGATK